jgi:AcrR family transcriptional regulator
MSTPAASRTPHAGPTRLLPRAERQAQVLRAAATAFARAGFAGTSMDDVAAAAGVTKLIVYRHFDSKEELYRAVLEQVSTRLAEEFAEGWRDGPRSGVSAQAHLRVARENPDGFRLLWRHAAREPAFADYAAEFRDLAVEAARGLLAPVIPDRSLHRWAAETSVGMLVEAVLNWLDVGDPARDDEFVELATASLRASVDSWGRTLGRRRG